MDSCFHCNFCNEDVPSCLLVRHSQSKRHKLLCTRDQKDGGAYVISSAFKCRIITYRLNAVKTNHFLNPEGFLTSIKPTIKKLLKLEIKTHKHVKVNSELMCTYVKTIVQENGDEIVRDSKSFVTKNALLSDGFNMDSFWDSTVSSIEGKMNEFQERDSGWSLEKILYLDLNINKYAPLRASSYIPLPPEIEAKKACINVKNKDEACFKWAVLAALYPQSDNPSRVIKYKQFEDRLDWSRVSFPVTFKDIKKFEKDNNLRVNVYGLDKKIVVPLYISRVNRDQKQQGTVRCVHLLYHENETTSHYSTIKSLSRLLATTNGNNQRKHYCEGCLHQFLSVQKLEQHVQMGCGEKAIVFPPTKDCATIKFENFHHKMKVPFTIYADFESILSPLDRKGNDMKNTHNITEHIPHSFAYYIQCAFDECFSRFTLHRGRDCVQKFINDLYADAEIIGEILTSTHVPMSADDIIRIKDSDMCHICEKPLVGECVIDHCHLTGAIRGRAHKKCNLKFVIPTFIPIIFHNLSGYDGHLFIKELAKSEGDINCIPHNKEKYISFSKTHGNITLRFIDSFKFLASSLDKLANNLTREQYHILPKLIASMSDDGVDDKGYRETALKLLSRKGVFPYEYIDSWERLEEDALPPAEAFYSRLCDSHITDADYQHAQEVWRTFNIKSLGEYSDLYLKTDVILLAEVFENFRKVCMETYKLDPCHYYTAPGLSWNAMLRFTGVQLDLLTDYEMIQFIKGGIRGGVSQVTRRHASSNNQFMKHHNLNEENVFIAYLDVNNLYGWAMMQHLPLNSFKWLSDEEINQFDIFAIQQDSSMGYILEVDLEYPNHLHDAHSDYPFCAETKPPPGSKTKKLLLTLHNKTKYIIHGVNLKQCVEKGLICKKIHRILSFHQSQWLKPYVDLNSAKRAQATSTFEKNLYKLFVNSIFGKSIENIEKRKTVHFCKHWEDTETITKPKYGLERFISRPNFHSCSIFSEDLVAVQLNPVKVVYNKPTYVGFTILELSKTLMYDFHYNYMQPKYGDKANLLYTDTDSFIYQIKTKNFYDDIKPDLESKFDTSDFQPDNIYNLPRVNKKVVGVMKDEALGRVIREFIGLRSKMYAYTLDTDDDTGRVECIKKNKGVTGATVRKILFEQYRQCLDMTNTFYDNTLSIVSDKHRVYTQVKKKKTLCGLDDKRHVNQDHITTLPWGHYSLQS